MPLNPEITAEFDSAMTPIKHWATSVTGLAVVHESNSEFPEDGAVLVHPLSLALAPASGPVEPHLSSAELTAEVLISIVGLPVWEAAGITAALALDAISDSDWVMGAEAPSVELWRALNRQPTPAFILRVPVRRVRIRQRARLVRSPLRITPAHVRSIAGRIISDDGQPLSGARVVRADGSAAAVVTDHRGRFRLSVATESEASLALSVVARGAKFTLSVIVPPVDSGGNLGDLAVSIPETV